MEDATCTTIYRQGNARFLRVSSVLVLHSCGESTLQVAALQVATTQSNDVACSNLQAIPIYPLFSLSIMERTTIFRRKARFAVARENSPATSTTSSDERDPLYWSATVRNETRVTSERQDDAMNYKMTVKAKVSGGFADPAAAREAESASGRERETEIAAANQPTSQLTDQTGSF